MQVEKKFLWKEDFFSPIREILRKLENKQVLNIAPIRCSLAGYIVAGFMRYSPKKIVIITPDPEKNEELYSSIKTFSEDKKIHKLVYLELVSSNKENKDLSSAISRTKAINNFKKEGQTLVSSIHALLQPVENMKIESLVFRINQRINREHLLERLTKGGYRRENNVMKEGEYTVRGGVIDIFPYSYLSPIRIEFFDEEIESIRTFDPLTQTSLQRVSQIEIPFFYESSFSNTDAFSFLEQEEDIYLCILEPVRVLESARIYKYDISYFLNSSKWHIINFLPFTKGEVDIILHVSYIPSIYLSQLEKELLPQKSNIVVYSIPNINKILSTDYKFYSLRGNIPEGFRLGNINIISIKDLQSHRFPYKREAILDFSQIKPGDLLVHMMYGIGKYQGITHLKGRDYIKILYAGGSVVYVPMTNLYLLHKYIPADREKEYPLDSISSENWKRRRKKAQQSIEKLARELLEIHAMRKLQKGYAFSSDDEEQIQFEKEFEYEDTPDQIRVVKEIKKDMESSLPMDRLVCADVGFGKTEVAIRAAFKAVKDGKQVVVLTPTTVLAQQHYSTFCKRMKNYPIIIELLSRFVPLSQQKIILDKISKGVVDIVIGTQRLLQNDIKFKDLGLIIIDEEQRFGVKAKEELKKLNITADVLSLTATPIPRTLYMSLTGLKDISIIRTPPEGRKSIITKVVYFDPEIIKNASLYEVSRGGQIFFVHNNVEELPKIVEYLREILTELRIDCIHGQMKSKDIKETMKRFLQKKIDLLVCTTIIESGLDIKNVNTLFVNNADKYGLSDLHQLRGRIGRGKERGYAYFMIDGSKDIGNKALYRLRAIEKYNFLGAGFEIAVQDMQLRGIGNLLGKEQHGHINAIGYQLYCKILEKVVERLHGKNFLNDVEVKICVPEKAFIPDSYIDSPEVKLEVYRLLAECKNLEELVRVEKLIKDRFGSFPEEVKNLIKEERLTIIARDKDIHFIKVQNNTLYLGVRKENKRISLPLSKNKCLYEEVEKILLSL